MNCVRVLRERVMPLSGILFCLSLFSCVSNNKTVNRHNVENAINKVYPALVRISVVYETPSKGRVIRRAGVGSGTVISQEGYILTNHHVVNKSPVKISVRFSNKEELPAVLIGTDPLTDLAIIKVDLSKRKDQTPMNIPEFGDSDLVAVGDPVMALGSPAALSQSVTLGIVSNMGMMAPRGGKFRLDGEDVGQLVRWIGHDAVIFGGNSGGPLINLEGQIVGVNEVGIGSLGGAIPSNLAQRIAAELIENGKIIRSWTGMKYRPVLKSSETDGVLVNSVIKNSPAQKAGIKPGDIITIFNGHKVSCNYNEEMATFNDLVFSLPPETEVPLTVYRKGELVELKMTTKEREEVQSVSKEVKDLGITVQNLTRTTMLGLKRKSKTGVFVNSVTAGGPAARAEPALRLGSVITEVNGETVKSQDDFLELIEKNKDQWMIKYDHGDASYVTVVKGTKAPVSAPPKTKKVWFGASLQVLNRHLKEKMNFKNSYGVLVTRLANNSPAKKAGFKKGDIITHIDGNGIEASQKRDIDNFNNMIKSYKDGTEVDFKIFRGSESKVLKCKLTYNNEENSILQKYTEDEFEFSITAKKKDVHVSKVISGGWASLAGLKQGDKVIEINGNKISSLESFKDTMNQVKNSKEEHVVFFIKRGQHTYFLESSPVWN